MDAQLLDQDLARHARQQPSPGWEWIVVDEEDWSGVNDCGAIFVPDREMKFDVDDEAWPMQGSC